MKKKLNMKKQMRDLDRRVLAHIRKYGPLNYMGLSVPWHNALDRLEAAKKIRFDRKAFGYVVR